MVKEEKISNFGISLNDIRPKMTNTKFLQLADQVLREKGFVLATEYCRLCRFTKTRLINIINGKEGYTKDLIVVRVSSKKTYVKEDVSYDNSYGSNDIIELGDSLLSCLQDMKKSTLDYQQGKITKVNHLLNRDKHKERLESIISKATESI